MLLASPSEQTHTMNWLVFAMKAQFVLRYVVVNIFKYNPDD
jgi:hypothetical protein